MYACVLACWLLQGRSVSSDIARIHFATTPAAWIDTAITTTPNDCMTCQCFLLNLNKHLLPPQAVYLHGRGVELWKGHWLDM